MSYIKTVFSGPVRVDVVEEIEPTERGRRFLVRVQATRKPYHKGETMLANTCDLWDKVKPNRVARMEWSGKTWLEEFEARVAKESAEPAARVDAFRAGRRIPRGRSGKPHPMKITIKSSEKLVFGFADGAAFRGTPRELVDRRDTPAQKIESIFYRGNPLVVGTVSLSHLLDGVSCVAEYVVTP